MHIFLGNLTDFKWLPPKLTVAKETNMVKSQNLHVAKYAQAKNLFYRQTQLDEIIKTKTELP